jgi:hypothetical protein
VNLKKDKILEFSKIKCIEVNNKNRVCVMFKQLVFFKINESFIIFKVCYLVIELILMYIFYGNCIFMNDDDDDVLIG